MPEIDPQAMPPCSPDRVPGFSAFFRAHYAYVHQNLRRLGVPAAAVEDAAQEVFLVVLRRTDAPITSVRGWLFGIVRRIAWRFRRGASRRERLVHALSFERAPRVEGDAQVLEREAAELLDRFLARLDDDKRAVFVLAELEQQTAGEIASALGIKENTVYSRLRAARQEFDRSCARLRVREQWHLGREAVLSQARRAHAPTPATRERVLACLIGPGVWAMSSEVAAATPTATSGGGFAAALSGFVGAPLATVGLVLLALTGAAGQPEASAAAGAGAYAGGRTDGGTGRGGAGVGEVNVVEDGAPAGEPSAEMDVLGDMSSAWAVLGGRAGGEAGASGAVNAAASSEAGASGGPGANAVCEGARANGGSRANAGSDGERASRGSGANAGSDGARAKGGSGANAGSDGARANGGPGLNAGSDGASGSSAANAMSDGAGTKAADRGGGAKDGPEANAGGRARRGREKDGSADRSQARRGSGPGEPVAPLLSPTPASDALAREAGLIAEARRAIRDGAWERSLALLATHAREFPDGTLRDERWLSQILATCASGQLDAGRAEIERLSRERPDLARRAKSLCAAPDDFSTTGAAGGD